MPENRTVWKSDNQGVKAETFLQTARRAGGGQPEWRGLMARQQQAEQIAPQLHADKLGGTTRE